MKAVAADSSLTHEKKLEKLAELKADPTKCPLKVCHPPSGFEFGMGCSMCADKDAEVDNIEAEEKAKEEKKAALRDPKKIKKNVFVYKKDFDCNGIVYYIGTNFGRNSFKNPALSNGRHGPKIKVTTSLLEPKSPTNIQFLTARSGGLCKTLSQSNSWIIFDFQSYSVTPTHYTLKHANIDSDALRSWRFSGSPDGRNWVVLREHKRDSGLKSKKNSTKTWALKCPAVGGKKPRYRCFCIMITEANSSRRFHLALGGFEVYGDLNV